MKIRLSLRLYFLAALLLLGVSLVMVFSALTANYFTKGMDTVTRGVMSDIAEVSGVQDGRPGQLIGFNVASRWNDVPDNIRRHFDQPPTEPFELEKHLEGGSLFSPPEEGYLLALVINNNGEQRYVSRAFAGDIPERLKRENFPHLFWIFVFCVAGITTFIVVLILMMRSVASPVEKLRDWAKSLSPDTLKQSPPDFRYKELNTLAQIVSNSLNSLQETLEREQVFLRHASHELRTPIAVIRTNTELLKKIGPQNEAKSRTVVERIERAGMTMTHLTDTLLWMSRENDIPLPEQEIDLANMIQELVEELRYLLQGKSVSVDVETASYLIQLPATGCRIVLTNLIRNAFQHTQQGRVIIKQAENCVSIQNLNTDNVFDENSDLGFGLGTGSHQ